MASKYLFKAPRYPSDKVPHIVAHHVGQLQVDVAYLQKVDFGAWKGSYEYLLVVIDVYSRYMWVIPLVKLSKKQVGEHIAEVIKWLESKGYSDVSLTSDQGVEFGNDKSGMTFKDLPGVGNIEHYLAPSPLQGYEGKSGTTSIVERSIGTLRKQLAQAKLEHPSNKSNSGFETILQECVKEYNDRKHSSIGVSPSEVIENISNPDVANNDQAFASRLDIGTFVIIMKPMRKYQKKTSSVRWGSKIYIVTGMDGWRYKLSDLNGIEYDERPLPLIQDLQVIPIQDVKLFIGDTANERHERLINEDTERNVILDERKQDTELNRLRLNSKNTGPSKSKRASPYRPDKEVIDLTH